MAVDGSTIEAVFEAHVEQVLAAVFRPGQVVTDNLWAHKGERVRSWSKPGGQGALLAPLLPEPS